MQRFWGVFEKRFVDLSMDEKAVLALVILMAIGLVVVAVSVLLQVARRFESGAEASEATQLLRKGMDRISKIDYLPEHARQSHSD